MFIKTWNLIRYQISTHAAWLGLGYLPSPLCLCLEWEAKEIRLFLSELAGLYCWPCTSWLSRCLRTDLCAMCCWTLQKIPAGFCCCSPMDSRIHQDVTSQTVWVSHACLQWCPPGHFCWDLLVPKAGPLKVLCMAIWRQLSPAWPTGTVSSLSEYPRVGSVSAA